MNTLKKFPASLSDLRSPYAVATVGMLLALRIVLGYFANASLPLFGNMFKVNLNFLPIAVAAIMFGPVNAAIVGGLGDVLSYILNPTGGAYFPGFTLNGILTGLILGIFLYKNNVSFRSVSVSWLINAVVVETFLSGFWLYFIYHVSNKQSFWFFILIRAACEAVILIPAILLIVGVGEIVKKIKVK